MKGVAWVRMGKDEKPVGCVSVGLDGRAVLCRIVKNTKEEGKSTKIGSHSIVPAMLLSVEPPTPHSPPHTALTVSAYPVKIEKEGEGAGSAKKACIICVGHSDGAVCIYKIDPIMLEEGENSRGNKGKRKGKVTKKRTLIPRIAPTIIFGVQHKWRSEEKDEPPSTQPITCSTSWGIGPRACFVFGSMDKILRVIQLCLKEDGSIVCETVRTTICQAPPSSMALLHHAEGLDLFVGFMDFRARQYRIDGAKVFIKPLRVFRGHKSPITALTPINVHGSDILVTCSLDGCARVWGLSALKMKDRDRDFETQSCSAAFNIDLNRYRAKELGDDPASTRVDYKPLCCVPEDNQTAILVGGSDCRFRRVSLGL